MSDSVSLLTKLPSNKVSQVPKSSPLSDQPIRNCQCTMCERCSVNACIIAAPIGSILQLAN